MIIIKSGYLYVVQFNESDFISYLEFRCVVIGDVKTISYPYFSCSQACISWMVLERDVHFLSSLNLHLDRIFDKKEPRGYRIDYLSVERFKRFKRWFGLSKGNAKRQYKLAYCIRNKASPSKCRKCRQPGVVP